MRAAALSCAVLCLVTSNCSRRPVPLDPASHGALMEWRAERLERLTADDGWLTVVGLQWLEPGENAFGSHPGNRIVVPGPAVPPHAGSLTLGPDGTVTVHVTAAGSVTLEGEALIERELASDAGGAPDVLAIGDVSFYLIDREGQLAVRIKDRSSARRRDFEGVESFPPDARYVVDARLEPLEPPREVEVPTAAGPPQRMMVPGVLRFELAGKRLSLEPWVSSADDETLLVVFSDVTSGRGTYGAGRFLAVDRPPSGTTTTLDFNYAYNPPCAFTPYATCPLPPPENRLPVAIRAGERHDGGH